MSAAVAEQVRTPPAAVPAPRLQASMRVSTVDDPLEREADEVAERVLRMPDPGPAVLQRCPGGCPDEVQRSPADDRRPPGRPAAAGAVRSVAVPSAVHAGVRAPGQRLDARTRTFMESRFGHDFAQVRVHTDAAAARSARDLGSRAYTVGRDIVFSSGAFTPASAAGRRLLAHELAHVVQQGVGGAVVTRPQPPVTALAGGGHRLAVAPPAPPDADRLEQQADAVAERVVHTSGSGLHGEELTRPAGRPPAVQHVRFPVPGSVSLCGATLTHVDVEPPRWRPLQPCLPPTVLVHRLNVVGREVSSRTTGRGRQIFNLHAGYYRDPGTGRLCAIVDDSKTCIAPRCLILGCFLTLREVIDAILDFLKKALTVIGLVLLALLLIIIGRGLIRGGPRPSPLPGGPMPVPIASADTDGGEEEQA